LEANDEKSFFHPLRTEEFDHGERLGPAWKLYYETVPHEGKTKQRLSNVLKGIARFKSPDHQRRVDNVCEVPGIPS